MAEKEFTKKITAAIKDIDKLVQSGEKALKTIKEVVMPKRDDEDEK